MKPLIAILALALAACRTTRPPAVDTGTLRTAIAKAQESTAAAAADGKEVKRLADVLGVRLDGVSLRIREIDFKAARALELLEK